MPSNYTGNPTATESPASAPAFNTYPIFALPVDADALNSASTYQPWKSTADNVAYLMRPHSRTFWQEQQINVTGSISSSQTPLTNNSRTSFLTSGGGSTGQFLLDTQTGYQGNACVMNIAGTSGNYAYEASSALVYGVGSNIQASFEVDYAFSGGSPSDLYIGFGDNQQLDAAVGYAYLHKANASASWVLSVNGTTSTLGAGFNAPGSSAYQTIRIDCYGAATPTGVANSNTAITKCYVNNVFAASVNTIPSASCYVSAGAHSFGASVTAVRVGVWTFFINRW